MATPHHLAPLGRGPLALGHSPAPVSRRQLLRSASMGFGWTALSALLADRSYAGLTENVPATHFSPRAKNVIFFFMPGGVSHVDSFDPKPALSRYHDQPVGDLANVKKTQATGTTARRWKESPWKFQAHGVAGTPVSELFPNIARCVDSICVIRSMVGELPLHAAGNIFLHSGRLRAGSPSLGSWISYGLGSESRNLPGYVLLESGTVPPGGRENYANGYLPADFQATSIQAQGVPVDNIIPAEAASQAAKMNWLRAQDRTFSAVVGHQDAVEAAIRNYEMAFRMQTVVPDVLNLATESAATHQRYGTDSANEQLRLYAIQCLRARRLIESGVRFVEVTANPLGYSVGTWDQHGKLKEDHEKNAVVTDQPIAALLQDLRQRGLLDETLVLWGTEMGRTPHTANGNGRDHHVGGFTVWLAGGGIRGGMVHGATDEFGMDAVENVVTMYDLHATLLHQLGLDHERLTYRYGGRDMRLTDVHGRVIFDILA